MSKDKLSKVLIVRVSEKVYNLIKEESIINNITTSEVIRNGLIHKQKHIEKQCI